MPGRTVVISNKMARDSPTEKLAVTWVNNLRKGKTKQCGHLGEWMFQVEETAHAKALFTK